MVKKINLIGYAYGDAGADLHVSEGPLIMQKSPYLLESTIPHEWNVILELDKKNEGIQHQVADICTTLATKVSNLISQKESFVVIGGDHTSAIGTWSGAYDALHKKGDIGLIWIDAHMDSHTPQTSMTGRLHGMPLAVLLGAGYERLINLLHHEKKLKPQNVCLIGVRSFESGEAQFLADHNVRIFYMEEIFKRGMQEVIKEAVDIVSKNTCGFGISFDLDAIDPEEAPAVAVPEKNGIKVQEVLKAMPLAFDHPKLIGTEILEFDPILDIDHKTEKIIGSLLALITR